MTDDLKERLRPPGRSVISKCADVDGADLSNAPLTYERVWLQGDGGDGVTWCQHPQDDEDVPYVRADFYAASLARITDLEARLAEAEAGEDALAEALAFYGDPSGWNQPPVKVLEGLFTTEYENQASKIRSDRGKVARAALAAYETRRKG